MSGIFGFSLWKPVPGEGEQILGGLEYWNRIYGAEASDCECLGISGFGCHIEHFSERFSYSGPILRRDGKIAVIDALLYNREELLGLWSPALADAISDEELLLRLVLEQGKESLARVNGDFAGAILDLATGQWSLFRDHMGVRPLFVYHDSRVFAFSTDIRGIAAIPGTDLRPNEKRLFLDFMRCNSLSLQETDYAMIRCALPGAWTEISRDAKGFSLREKPYWKLRSRKIRFRREEDYARELRTLVEDAVRCRLDAIPGLIGAELSGGLDSSVIDILINRNGRKGIYYSWSNDTKVLPLDQQLDERSVIEDICRQENIECRYMLRSDGRCTTDVYEKVIPSFVNTFELSYGSNWMRSQGARVVFTGHGGDEGVSHRAGRFELLCSGEIFPYLKLFHADLEGISLRLPKTVFSAARDAWEQMKRQHETLNETDLVCPVLDAAFNSRMAADFKEPTFYFFTKPYRYVRQGGTRDRLDNVAYQGASVGVRYLLPFVDHRVMDFAVSIPRHLYVSPKENRVIYRKAFADLMPKSLLDVRYKAMVSTRHLKRSKMSPEAYQINRSFLVSRLDPDYWKGILDLEAIAHREQPADPESREARSFRYDTYGLYRCILIQNTALLAKNWRDIDENPNLL